MVLTGAAILCREHGDRVGTQVCSGAVTPSSTLTGFSFPDLLTIDSSGNLYVASEFTTTVKKLAPGSTTAMTATLTASAVPTGLAADSSGNVFVATSTTLSRFNAGSTTASAQLQGLNGPEAMVSILGGNLFVANGQGSTVSKFSPGDTTASAYVNSLNHPDALAFDSSGNLYVSNSLSFNVSKFTPALHLPNDDFLA